MPGCPDASFWSQQLGTRGSCSLHVQSVFALKGRLFRGTSLDRRGSRSELGSGTWRFIYGTSEVAFERRVLWSPTGKLTWSRLACQLLGRVCLQMPELGPLPPTPGRHEGIADVTNRKGRGRRQAQVA